MAKRPEPKTKFPLFANMPRDVQNLREQSHKHTREQNRKEFKDRVLLGQNQGLS